MTVERVIIACHSGVIASLLQRFCDELFEGVLCVEVVRDSGVLDAGLCMRGFDLLLMENSGFAGRQGIERSCQRFV